MSHVLPDRLTAYGVTLHRLAAEHIELVRQWRNHPEVARHMVSDAHIDAAQQQAWFERVRDASDRACYVVDYRGTPCAFASVTSTDGRALDESSSLEAAIYLAPDSPLRGSMLAFAPALALNDACFDTLGCEQLVARVKPDNAPALRFNRQMGYRESGHDGKLVRMTLSPSDYAAGTRQLKHMLSRPRTTTSHARDNAAS